MTTNSAEAAGDLPDSLLTPDMTGWITTQLRWRR